MHRGGAGRRDRRGPHRQGRQDAAVPVRGRREDDDHVRSAGCCPSCSSRTADLSSPWSSPDAGCSSPSGPAGPRAATWPSTCSWSASATKTKSGGEIDRALTCVSAESLAPDAEGGIWWHGVLEDSVKHTVGVSQDLREGVRLSIEIIANEVVSRRRAQGLDPLPQDQAQPLARQALRYLYRILFLLYAEASPELEVLPVGAEEYDQGYGLDRLRDLTLVELTGPRAMDGTHLYDSLARLFTLVDQGHEPPEAKDGEQDGLVFHSLRADLFLPEGDRADRRDRPRERGAAAGAAPPAAQQGGPGQGPRLHLLRRTRHQPARRGVRGPDVLHGLLRRDRPVRGGQGRRPVQGVVGGPGRAGRRHRAERTSSASRTRSPARRRRSSTSGARSSSGSPAGNASSRRRTTRPRC